MSAPNATHCVVVSDRAGCSWVYSVGSEEWCDDAYYRACKDWPGPDYIVTIGLTEPDE